MCNCAQVHWSVRARTAAPVQRILDVTAVDDYDDDGIEDDESDTEFGADAVNRLLNCLVDSATPSHRGHEITAALTSLCNVGTRGWL